MLWEEAILGDFKRKWQESKAFRWRLAIIRSELGGGEGVKVEGPSNEARGGIVDADSSCSGFF